MAERITGNGNADLIQLDFLTPEEANSEIEKLAKEKGYGTGVSFFLANDGAEKVSKVDVKKTLKTLVKTKRKDGLTKKGIDPTFGLLMMMREEETKK